MAQVDTNEIIKKYLSPREDYSTFEVVYQSANGIQGGNILVIVNNAPIFIVTREGELVEDPEIVLSVSRDYVDSRPPELLVADADSIAGSIVRETQRRKEKKESTEAGEIALEKVKKLREKIQGAKRWLIGVDFTVIDEQVQELEDTAGDISASQSLQETALLNNSFNRQIVQFSSFVNSLERNAIRLGASINATREAQKLVNDKTVRVGRDDASVKEAQAELSELQTLLEEEFDKIATFSQLKEEDSLELFNRSQALLEKLGGIRPNGIDLISTILPFIAIIAILAGVVFYFKQLRERQRKEDEGETNSEMPPEQMPIKKK
ncbi:MAG: hypothetical protein Q8R15_02880 [Candidatus Micrarchaeota archaeon]|nr:hypothetical protein [Candidatus Micrarchaeota archaeon]